MSGDEPFISLRNVRKVYRSKGAEFLAVSDVTMDVRKASWSRWSGRPAAARPRC